MPVNGAVVPIEVKAGMGRTLKSLQFFLATHAKSPYGIRCSAQNYSVYQNVHSYPLYALAQVMSLSNAAMKQAIMNLIST